MIVGRLLLCRCPTLGALVRPSCLYQRPTCLYQRPTCLQQYQPPQLQQKRTLFTSGGRKGVIQTLKQYGPVFFVFHTCTSIITLGFFYVLISRGFDATPLVDFSSQFIDVDSLLNRYGYDRSLMTEPNSTTCGIISFILYKLSSPLRIALDALMVPVLVRLLRGLGVVQPERPVDDKSVEMAIMKIEQFDKRYDLVVLDPAVRAIRRRVKVRKERRARQIKKYDETQRKINKVFKKKMEGGVKEGGGKKD